MRLFFIYIFLLIGVSEASGQSNLVWYELTEKDGLADNHVNCIFQDSRGLMWFGTGYGLNNYDGSEMRTILAGGLKKSLPNNAVNDITEDKQQQLWIATGYGLCQLSLSDGGIRNYFVEGDDPVQNRFYGVAVTDSLVLLATENGLTLFNTHNKQFRTVRNPSSYPGCNRITRIVVDSKKRNWLCTYNGVWTYDIGTGRFDAWDNPANDPLYDGLINDLYEDNEGQLWFGSWNKGLKKIDPATRTITCYLPWPGSSTNLLSITGLRNRTGQYEIWTTSNLSRVDEAVHRFIPLIADSTDARRKLNAYRLYTDRQNLLWIATDNGLRIYNPYQQFFFTRILSSFTPLTSQGVSLLPYQDGFLLGGEGSSALLHFSTSITAQKNLSAVIPGNAAVMNIQQSPSGEFWLCTSNGLVVLDAGFRLRRHYEHVENENGSLPRNFMNNVLFRSNGETWIFPWRKGAWRLDAVTNKFSRIVSPGGDTVFGNANIAKMVEDATGKCWAADFTGGLFCYDARSGVTRQVIPDSRLTNLYLYNGKIWTVSADKIYTVDPDQYTVTAIALPAGYNKYEYDFIPDGKGHIWIATKNGLLLYDTTSQQFRTFSEQEGLHTNLLDVSFARLANGHILMAGNTWASLLNPDDFTGKNSGSPLVFRGMLTDKKEYSGNAVTYDLDWNEKNITLQWAILNYSNAQANRYYYKLEGVQDDWQPAGNRGIAVFTGLAPGHYTFHYKAQAPDGSQPLTGEIVLVIHPPFWRTWWFNVLALSLVAFVFYRVVRYLAQRKLKERLLLLEKEQAIEKERNRISRDMHDELGSGLTKIAILSEVARSQPEQAAGQIEKISDTARQLVDNLDEMVWSLNPKNDSLDKLIGYIVEYTHQFLEGSSMEATIQLPDPLPTATISEEKRRNILMVVKEFLNNTVKHSGASKVILSAAYVSGTFRIILEDNGCGFDAAQVSSFSNGLQHMQQRIIHAGGHFELTSSLGHGTRLCLHIPAAG